MGDHVICKVSELPPGGRRIVELEGRSIGVFNVHGTFYALRNACPHQGGPLCMGRVKGMMAASAPQTYEYVKEGEVLVCPWHGWEFDIPTGRSIFNPHRVRVKTYGVTVEAGEDPSVETYEVTVEEDSVVVHL